MVDDGDGYRESPETADRPEEKAFDCRNVGGVQGDGVASAGYDSPTMARRRRRTPAESPTRSGEEKQAREAAILAKIKGEEGGDLI